MTTLSDLDLMDRVADGGDPDRGRRVFFSNLSTCSSCHAVESRGGDLGPELTRVAQSKSRKQFVNSILEPGDDISPEYQGWFIRLKNGKEFQGRQIDIGGSNIELYTYANGNMNFRKDSIETYGMLKGSLMPRGLMQKLTIADLRDLLAYLESTAQ
jgi:putative heme-binding domain-containing protein